MNDRPKLRDPGDEAFWARLYFVNFMQRFLVNPDPDNPHEHPVDVTLEDKLKKEASGILAWMIRGFHDWRQNNNTFLESPSMKAEKDTYKEVSDPVRQFVGAFADRFNRNKKYTSTHLHTFFRFWARRNAIWNREESTFGPKTFAKRLKKIVGALKHSRSGGTSHYRGLHLEDDPLYKEWMANGYGESESQNGRGFGRVIHKCECKTCKEAW